MMKETMMTTMAMAIKETMVMTLSMAVIATVVVLTTKKMITRENMTMFKMNKMKIWTPKMPSNAWSTLKM